MSTRRTLLVVATVPGLVVLGAVSCSAGNYQSGRSFSTPSYSTAGRGVYGFGANGQSFVYKPAPSVGSGASGNRAMGTNIPSPQYRLDSLTAPRTKVSPTPRYNPQPHYFSGRMWYPRGY